MNDSTNKTRILVVEDEPALRYLLTYLLGQIYEVEAVGSTAAALNLAATRHFDVFLLDINLREKRTGFDLLQDLRAVAQYEQTPAIACTAYVTPYNVDSYYERGFDDCVGKPFTRASLVRALTTVLHNAGHVDRWPRIPHNLAA